MSRRRSLPAAVDWTGFNSFYDLYRARLVAYLIGAGASVLDAQDCTHDTLLAVWARRADLRGTQEEWADYVLVAGRHRYLDLVHERRDVVVSDDLLVSVVSDAEQPEDAAQRSEARRALGVALSTMRPRDRAVLIDVEVHGLGYPALVHRYGASENTLRQVRFRAANRLAKLMAGYAPGVVAIPVGLSRRVLAGLRSAWRSCCEAVTTLAQPQPVTVMLSALTMFAGPFGLPLGTPSAQALAPGSIAVIEGWLRPHAGFGPFLHGPHAEPPRTFNADRQTGSLQSATEPPPSPVRRSIPRPPLFCVDTTCPAVSPDNKHVLTVHAPGPIGDREVLRQDVAPTCWAAEQAPDTAWTSCHTDGNPPPTM